MDLTGLRPTAPTPSCLSWGWIHLMNPGLIRRAIVDSLRILDGNKYDPENDYFFSTKMTSLSPGRLYEDPLLRNIPQTHCP